MINCREFYDALVGSGIDFFTGVPDSLLKDFNAYVMDNANKDMHVIAANEGGAIALATGYHLATGKFGLVYMQNSGQGNAINPLTSLADKEVYGVPMLLLIGWRGEPGAHDEPQHIKQGRITLSLLETLGIAHEILGDDTESAKKSIQKGIEHMLSSMSPYALIVRKGSFESYELKNKIATSYELSREEALKLVIRHLDARDIIISTTGMLSRELFEHRERKGEGHEKDFLTVGSMGHSSQIALGLALAKPNRQVYCFDGDGAVIMHLGSLAIIGNQKPKNFKHVIFNNGAHDSVGGQPTAGFSINIPVVAKACGYSHVWRVETSDEIDKKMKEMNKLEGPCLLEIIVNKGSRKDLGRPATSPQENKKAFMENLKE